MAKRSDEYIEKEAKRIGYRIMMEELDNLIRSELSDAQRVAIQDQQEKIKELLGAL